MRSARVEPERLERPLGGAVCEGWRLGRVALRARRFGGSRGA